MRRNVCRHTYRNARCTIHQKIWKSCRKYDRLFFCLIKVWCKIHRIFVDVRCKLHGNFAQSSLCITHGRSTVTVHRTKVPVSVHKRVPCGPFLCHVHQCTINRAVPMRMIFTHRITDDTGTFSVRLIRTVVQLDHGV